MNIVSLETIKDHAEACSQIEDIFFMCSSIKDFESLDKKNAFYKRWTGPYFDHCLDDFYVALDSGDRVLGYLSGCSDTIGKKQHFLEFAVYDLFSDLLAEYPAHLHINCHSDTQGKGVGSQLIAHYDQVLQKKSAEGLHIITTPDAKNISFYQKNGFSFSEVRKLGKTDLQFMGIKF